MPEALRICPQCGLETTGAACARDGFATVVRGRIGGAAAGREGQTIGGRYRLDQTLESTTVGVAYRGQDLVRMRPVTVRVFAASYSASLGLIARFQQEGQLLPGLVHPNVLQTIEHGIADDGALFQAIEGVHGPSLAEVLKRDGPFEPDRATMIAIQITSALATAHALGILHRSLSLESVLLTSTAPAGTDDVVKVRDFGIVRILADENAASFQYPVELHPAWRALAPEQARGKAISGHADVYSLGAMIYELLTGRPVFQEQSPADLMVAHMVKMPGALAGVERTGAAVPPTLAELVHRCLEKKPWNRPDGATAVLAQLEEIAQQMGLRAQQLLSRAAPALPPAVAQALARAPRTTERSRPSSASRLALAAVTPLPSEPTPPTSAQGTALREARAPEPPAAPAPPAAAAVFAASEALARPLDLSGTPSTRQRQRPPTGPRPYVAVDANASASEESPRSARRSAIIGFVVGITIAGVAAALAIIAFTDDSPSAREGHARAASQERPATAPATAASATAVAALDAVGAPDATRASDAQAIAVAEEVAAPQDASALAAVADPAPADAGPHDASGLAAAGQAEVWDGAATKIGAPKLPTAVPPKQDAPPIGEGPKTPPPKTEPKTEPKAKDPFADVEDPDVIAKTPPKENSKRRVMVVSEPAGATLSIRGMQVGVTPMLVEWDDLGQQLLLTIAKPGFKSYQANIGPSTGATLRVQLWPE